MRPGARQVLLAATLPSEATRSAGPAIATKALLAIEGAQGAPLLAVGRFGLLGLLRGGLGKSFSRTTLANGAVASVRPLANPVGSAADALGTVVG